MGYTQWCCSSPDCCHTKRSASGVKPLLSALRGEGWRTVDTVSAELGPRLPVAAYCVHTSRQYWSPVFHNRWLLAEMSRIAADVIQICHQTDVEPGIFTVIHTWGRDQQWHPHIHLSTTAGGVTSGHTGKIFILRP